MVSIEDMTPEQLEIYISTLSTISPCARAEVEKLQSKLAMKRYVADIESSNSN